MSSRTGRKRGKDAASTSLKVRSMHLRGQRVLGVLLQTAEVLREMEQRSRKGDAKFLIWVVTPVLTYLFRETRLTRTATSMALTTPSRFPVSHSSNN